MQRAREHGVREFVRKPMNFEDYSKVILKTIQDWAT